MQCVKTVNIDDFNVVKSGLMQVKYRHKPCAFSYPCKWSLLLLSPICKAFPFGVNNGDPDRQR